MEIGFEKLIQFAVNYGLGVILSIAILLLAKYLLTKVFEQHKAERDNWNKIADMHFKSQEEAHKYQRDEHREMIDILKRMNNR